MATGIKAKGIYLSPMLALMLTLVLAFFFGSIQLPNRFGDY